jgi:hypothetical protein
MRYALTALLLLSLPACGGAVLRVPESAPLEMRVTWVRVQPSEISFYCARANVRLRQFGQHAVACTDALPASGSCTIYTTSEVTLETLGDEATHCFLGAWHN